MNKLVNRIINKPGIKHNLSQLTFIFMNIEIPDILSQISNIKISNIRNIKYKEKIKSEENILFSVLTIFFLTENYLC